MQIRGLLGREPLPQTIVAFSLTPECVSRTWEHKTPPLSRRLEAMRALADHGWRIGLRLDPLIYHEGFESSYSELFRECFRALPVESIHSVTLGSLRFPREMFSTIRRLYPDSALLAGPLESQGSLVSYADEIEESLFDHCRRELSQWIDGERLFFSSGVSA